ncbi:MAG: hypothetical protein WCE30_05340 [Mycobacterium sp.]
MGEPPEGAIAMAVRLSGQPRDMVLAGFKLGVEFSANVIKVCTDEKTNETLAEATPKECLELAEALVRDQSAAAIAQLEAGGDWPAT